jgi:glycosyltransferase involved in cell wall biosynthesis
MRILALSHLSASHNMGGAEATLIHMLDKWKTLRPDSTFNVVSRAPSGLLQVELSARSIEFQTIDFGGWVLGNVIEEPLGYLSEALQDSKAVRRLLDIMREWKPDVVITNTIVSPWAAYAAGILGIPHVWFVHEYGDLDHGLDFRLSPKGTFSDIGLLSELVVTNSEAIQDHVSTWIAPSKLMITYPAIDFESARSLAQLLPEKERETKHVERTSDEPFRAMIAGRVSVSKGHLLLVEAIGRLHSEGYEICLDVVGVCEGDDGDLARQLVRDLDLGRWVTLVGESTNPFWYMNRADVCITASRNEAFGRVTVEYLALGKPVIVSQTGAGAELIVHGTEGFLFDPENLDSLVEALRSAMDDVEALPVLGANALARSEVIAQKYPLEDVIRRVEAIVQSGPSGFLSLPRLASFWTDSPKNGNRAFYDWQSNEADIRSTITWKVGLAIVEPIQKLARIVKKKP